MGRDPRGRLNPDKDPGSPPSPRGRGGRPRLGGVAIASLVAAYVGLVWLARGELGMTWDEPYFFERVHDLRAWLGELAGNPAGRAAALSAEGMAKSWRFARQVPDQHPPVPELLGLVTGEVFGRWLGPLRAYRLSTVLVYSFAAGVLFRLVRSRWGDWAAWAALGALVFNPRPFADAQLFTADSDTGAFWYLAAVSYLRSCETGRSPWRFGIFAGLAIMCKATGVLVFPASVLWASIHRPPGWWRPLAWSVPVVPAVMVAVMPPWWRDPAGRIARWIQAFLAYPQKVPVAYLGTVYDSVHDFLPWHNTAVLIATMVPPGLLLLAGLGLGALAFTAARRRGTPAIPGGGFLPGRVVLSWAAIHFLTWPILRIFPFLPAHDGLRQLVPAFYFLPVLAGFGARWLSGLLGLGGRLAGRAVVVGCVAGPAWATLHIHPFELSYYNAFIGGPSGAKAAGMESTYFWDPATDEVLGWMNANLPPDSIVLIAPSPNVLTFGWEQRWGRLRRDLTFLNLDTLEGQRWPTLLAGPRPFFLILQMRQGLYLPRKPGDPGLLARLAASPAFYEFAPARVGVRLLAIFDRGDILRVLREAGKIPAPPGPESSGSGGARGTAPEAPAD